METTSLPTQPAQPTVDSGEKALAIFCHLSVFLGMPILLPLLVYLLKRNSGSFAEAHAREALNFHISTAIYGVFGVILLFVLIGFPLLIALAFLTLICAIIGAIRASEGGFYYYPLTLRLIP